ncbi:glycerophosphodiester phosphodiesterase family protein [Virgibacillus dakarensis]|uniref:glycerophosphodiester phosphodiesterase family protein n=1 Tax=Virgibacillus dakarensis TaxID=1917889 RepID=UPI0013564762|nr:glycerophosphodiester phosphodiesterase family protein [Virgibacillus dakarensis]
MKVKFLLLAILCVFVFSYTLGSSVTAASTDNWLQDNKSELSAHRGAHVVAPENSVEAIKWAGLLGYGFVEIDIQTTKDGHYVLMHDSTINRTTTGSGKVKNLTLEEIKSYSMVDEDGTKTNYKVPTLSEALEAAHKYDVGVNFDGSKGDWNDKQFVDYIMDAAEEAGVLDHSFFVLSNKEIRDQFNAWYPEATVTFLGNALKNVDKDIEELKKYNSSIYTTSIDNIDQEAAKKIDEADIKTHLYKVNSAETYTKAIKLQPRLIETDVIVPGGADKLKTSVEKLQNDGVIESVQAAHELELHLTAVNHFEKQEKSQKVVKHMNGFKKIIEHQKNKELIPEYVNNILEVNANKIINKWQ